MTNKHNTGTSWSFITDHVEDCAYWENGFTKEECEAIIFLGESKQLKEAKVIAEDPELQGVRDSEVSWLYPEDCEWLFRRLTSIITELNNQYFKFNLFGFTEGFQFTKYSAPGGKYGKHIDKLFSGQIRKLSVTMQLSDPSTYTGGELKLYNSENPVIGKKDQGYITVFPSYILHEVAPVTVGTRYSLVAWATGEPFK
jgi:PKHD-type hydroxylase